MSTTTEKYIGEAALNDSPTKKLSLKIGDGVITPEHLSDRVMTEVISPAIVQAIEEYQSIDEDSSIVLVSGCGIDTDGSYFFTITFDTLKNTIVSNEADGKAVFLKLTDKQDDLLCSLAYTKYNSSTNNIVLMFDAFFESYKKNYCLLLSRGSSGEIVVEEDYSIESENYTTEEKEKLNRLIDVSTVSVNGVQQAIDNNTLDVKTSKTIEIVGRAPEENEEPSPGSHTWLYEVQDISTPEELAEIITEYPQVLIHVTDPDLEDAYYQYNETWSAVVGGLTFFPLSNVIYAERAYSINGVNDALVVYIYEFSYSVSDTPTISNIDWNASIGNVVRDARSATISGDYVYETTDEETQETTRHGITDVAKITVNSGGVKVITQEINGTVLPFKWNNEKVLVESDLDDYSSLDATDKAKLDALPTASEIESTYVKKTQINQANGVAGLTSSSKLSTSVIPVASEITSSSTLPATSAAVYNYVQDLETGNVTDDAYVHTDNNYTTTEKNKLSGIASGAEVNVQSDWSITDTTSDAYIKNKPAIPSQLSDLSDGDSVITTSTLSENYYTKSETYSQAQVDALIETGSSGSEGLAYIGDTFGTATSTATTFSAYSDTVWTKTQSLSDTQKSTARTNIDVYSKTEIDEMVVSSGGGTVTSVTMNELSYTPSSTGVIDLGTVITDVSSLATTSSVNTALARKQDTLVSGTNIKTINNIDVIGSGNIDLTETFYTKEQIQELLANLVSQADWTLTPIEYDTYYYDSDRVAVNITVEMLAVTNTKNSKLYLINDTGADHGYPYFRPVGTTTWICTSDVAGTTYESIDISWYDESWNTDGFAPYSLFEYLIS